MGHEDTGPRNSRPRLWRFARALFTTNLNAALALRGAFVMQAVFMILNNVAFFVFWWVLLRRVPHLRGWQLADVEALFGITATSFGLVVAVTGGVRQLAQFIDEGELDTLLTQPKPTLLYALGIRSRPSGFGDIVSGIGFLSISGHLTVAMIPLVNLKRYRPRVVAIKCIDLYGRYRVLQK